MIQWRRKKTGRRLVGRTIRQGRVSTCRRKPFGAGIGTSETLTLLRGDGRLELDQVDCLLGVDVGSEIIHQHGDGGDEAWVGAVEILEGLKLLFDLRMSETEKSRPTHTHTHTHRGSKGTTDLLVVVVVAVILLFMAEVLLHGRE